MCIMYTNILYYFIISVFPYLSLIRKYYITLQRYTYISSHIYFSSIEMSRLNWKYIEIILLNISCFFFFFFTSQQCMRSLLLHSYHGYQNLHSLIILRIMFVLFLDQILKKTKFSLFIFHLELFQNFFMNFYIMLNVYSTCNVFCRFFL